MGNSIIVIPDIQFYTGEPHNYGVLERMIRWISENQEREGIQAVLQLGDLTNHNTRKEWERARVAFQRLDEKIPYFLTVGNHDLGFEYLCSDRNTYFNQYFSLEQNSLNAEACLAQYKVGELENVLYEVTIGGQKWQVLSLEFGPRNEVVNWARELMGTYHKAPTILLSHDFVDHYSTLFTPNGEAGRSQKDTPNSPHLYNISSLAGGVNCGEELWEKLVRDSPNICLSLNGHHKPYTLGARSNEAIDQYYLAQSRRCDTRSDGSKFHQVLFNAQWEPKGGNGLMLKVDLDSSQIAFEVISSEIEISIDTVPAREEDLKFTLER